MADKAVVTVQELTKKTITSPKTNKPLAVVEFKSTSGMLFKGFQNQVEGIDEGDTVEVIYQPIQTKAGNYNSITSVNITLEPVTESAGSASSEGGTKTTGTKAKQASSLADPAEQTKAFLTTNNFSHGSSSKDISMEVSGLLQALINTGKYNETDENGKTYIASKLLDAHLRIALGIKRAVATELETTGKA